MFFFVQVHGREINILFGLKRGLQREVEEQSSLCEIFVYRGCTKLLEGFCPNSNLLCKLNVYKIVIKCKSIISHKEWPSVFT